MSTLVEPSAKAPRTTAADLLPLLTAALRAVLALLVPILVLSVLAWIASVRSTSSLAAVCRVGADLWLLAHGATVAVVGGEVGLAPLGITLLAVLSAVRAVRAWARDQGAAERPVPFWAAVGTFAGGYALLAGFLALVSRSGVSAAAPVGSAVGGLLVGGAGALAALWPHRPPLPAAVPAPVAAALRPALTACAGLLATGSLVVAAALARGHSGVLLLHEALDPGVVGGALLTLAQVLLLPTLAVWGLAWASGTGFAVGTGTSVAPGGTSLEALPTVPVLGALPAPGPAPVLAWAVLALPVLVGALAWALQTRRGPVPAALLQRCGAAALTGVLAGALTGLLALAASGPAGAGRMGELGPSPLLTAAAVAGEVAAGALLALFADRALRARRGARHVVVLPEEGRAPGRLLTDD
ncbi:hypothetical protein GTQ99_19970 [Kineococcus sp. T13]|uniref:cell division protein PerM n=1 Tax=Kineococcus vitellinus TaxID=2696565 RepID=UPI0014124324|nr:DUF6350 family protein [Kineococcus vitellinus]NAZ77670.1 hypothetical protein [Kineococcus vitellinus]